MNSLPNSEPDGLHVDTGAIQPASKDHQLASHQQPTLSTYQPSGADLDLPLVGLSGLLKDAPKGAQIFINIQGNTLSNIGNHTSHSNNRLENIGNDHSSRVHQASYRQQTYKRARKPTKPSSVVPFMFLVGWGLAIGIVIALGQSNQQPPTNSSWSAPNGYNQTPSQQGGW